MKHMLAADSPSAQLSMSLCCRLESNTVAAPGVMTSLRRRAVSAVTLPFDLVSGITAGIASSTGIDRKATPRHSGRIAGVAIRRLH